MDPVTLVFERTVRAPVEVVWRAFANTDAFNRVAGLGFSFEEEPQPDGSVRRRGRVKRFGLEITWDELPFRFVAPDRFRSVRVFDNGPVASVDTSFHLEDAAGDTRLTYRVALTPRHWLLRPVVAVEARVGTSPQLSRALNAVVAALGADVPDFDPPPPLDGLAQDLLRERLAALGDAAVAEALERVVRSAPLAIQDRIRPLRLAEQTGRPLDVVLDAVFDGLASSALDARLLLLCPSCLGAKEELSELDPTGRTLHCTTCGITWEGSLSDLVEVAFRPSPAIRSIAVPVDCVQSPSRTPHVRLQVVLGVGETLVEQLELAQGCYRLEAGITRGAAHLEVVPDGPTRATFDLTDAGVVPKRAEVAAGAVELVVRSRIDHEAPFALAERWRPGDALTLGAFLDHPRGVRWALTHPDVELAPREGAVVVVLTEPSWSPESDGELVAALRAVLVERGLDPVHDANGRLIGFTDDLARALGALEAVGGHGRVAGMSVGRCTSIRGKGGEVLVGPAVDVALATARQAGWGRIVMDAATAENPRLARAIHDLGPRAELVDAWGPRPALLRFKEAQGRVPGRAGRRGRVAGRIGAWELGEPVGEGSMGTVFSATGDDGSQVMLKVLKAELSLDYRYAAAFHNEARLGWTVDHPRVCKVLDWGLEPRHQVLYLVMEPLEGPSLQVHVKEHGPLGEVALRALARDLLDALTAIHDAGVLHRDLKPSNVVLEPEGATLLDFGVALPLGTEAPVAGTPSWLSPEQARGDVLDERSDLYQLALLLVRAGTGHWPFPGKRAAERMAWRDAHELEVLPHGLPEGWEPVLLQALRRDRSERPASARALRSRLLGAPS